MPAAIFVGVSLVVFTGISSLGSVLPLNYHVRPDGDDTNPGTVQKPFATLVKAREAVRAGRLMGEAVSVVVHGGIYRLESPLEFNAADSGTEASPVVWKAASGETVCIIGGQVVPADAIKPVTDETITPVAEAPFSSAAANTTLSMTTFLWIADWRFISTTGCKTGMRTRLRRAESSNNG